MHSPPSTNFCRMNLTFHRFHVERARVCTFISAYQSNAHFCRVHQTLFQISKPLLFIRGQSVDAFTSPRNIESTRFYARELFRSSKILSKFVWDTQRIRGLSLKHHHVSHQILCLSIPNMFIKLL